MENVTLEVVTGDIVDVIGAGIALPKNTYPGQVEWRTVTLGGYPRPYLAIARLLLSATEQQRLGIQNPRDTWCPVTGHVKSGKIRIVD